MVTDIVYSKVLVYLSHYNCSFHIVSYISASHASTIPRTYYMNLEVINQAGIAVSVNYKDGKESIDLPAGGVGNIKYSVLSIVPPDSIVYRVHESESGEMLLLNGKSELSITPRLSSESKYRIIITKEGLYRSLVFLSWPLFGWGI